MLADFRRNRKSTVALLFAVMAVPLVGLVGLAVDYGIWNQTYASMSLAANGAALNAVKIAASGELAQETTANYTAQGVTAGKQWFEASISGSGNAAHLSSLVPNVTITSGTTVTATVSYTGTVSATFGRIFGKQSYPITLSATASVAAAPYMEIVMMVDNSSSMDIAATTSDIQKLMGLSACDPTNNFVTSDGVNFYANGADTYNDYAAFQFYVAGGAGGGVYDGTITNPLVYNGISFPGVTNYVGAGGGPYKAGASQMGPQCTNSPKVNGYYPYAGPPCAFACHWDTNAGHNGNFQDLFGMARKNGIKLRFDLVKNSVKTVLSAMQQENLAINNLSVGIYAFNRTVTQVYPSNCTPQAFGCEAGSDFTTAQALVGSPPALPSTTDTGLLPSTAGFSNNDDTPFPEDMTTLANTYVTAAGDGTKSTTPRKTLMIITDGFQDDPNIAWPNDRSAFNYSYCQQFKNLGYRVYVVYTPYYPLNHNWYLTYGIPIVEGTGDGSIPYNLKQCSTYENGKYDYLSASNQTELDTDLLNFLQQALTSPASFTN